VGSAQDRALPPEFWLHWFPIPGETERVAVRAEELGFDGLLLADSQNLVGDPFVELGVLTRSTSRLGLGTGIVNPLTRHPAVVASALASLQIESRGRAVLGVGRGDSSLAQIGLAAPSTGRLGAFVTQVRGLLRGEAVDVGGASSRIAWLADRTDMRPPPVELAATGPRTIALAATVSDRLMLTLGADVERVAAAIAAARTARASVGLDPDALRVGAYVNVACCPDVAQARDLVRGSAAIFAHFSSMSAPAAAGLADADARVVAELGASYQESRHGLSAAGHAGALDDAFIDRFAIVGPPDRCRDRLSELVRLGLDRIVLVPGSRDSDRRLLDDANAALAGEVLPALRSLR
jgi:5,10-methylenetetrahydromethanopterin reductase